MPKIVLVAPEIPGNTGSIGRTCLALNFELILIHPLGFDLSEKALRRAGLDYWKDVKLTEYSNFEEFIKSEKPNIHDLSFFSKTAQKVYFEQKYSKNSYLIFGSETKGLPNYIMETYKQRLVRLPMFSDKVRSLNLSNVATAVAFEVVRQQQFS